MRMGLFSLDGQTKIAEGSSRLLVDSETFAWRGHMNSEEITQFSHPIGGVGYIIAAYSGLNGSAGMVWPAKTGTAPIGWFIIETDWTASIPESIGGGSPNTYLGAVRCGVDQAGGGVVPMLLLLR